MSAQKGILGKKLGMTQIIGQDGSAIPVTVIEAGPCVVAGKRTQEKDGYTSLQLGLGAVKERRVTKPVAGWFKKQGVAPARYVREVKFSDTDAYQVGQEIKADIFAEGDLVDVVGTSKGKGFQGTMKRHNFGGGPRSHGSMTHRQPASSGSTDAARTIKGTRKPGHMGAVRVTAQGLKVVKVDLPRNLILVRGSVPGAINSLVVLKNSVKA
ncbi:MAG: 50S ribosomal protein L3 [Armatimonadetes bacterium]|nr:50S ribosomal protein L3 [Armatimonadota bacterium]